jgi:His-Xaa-Ser system protein HxsD
MADDTLDFEVDDKEMTVTLTVEKSLYSLEAIQISAHVFEKKAEVLLAEDDDEYEITLRSKRKGSAEFLTELGGTFANELLNQEYRFVVGRFNQKISSLIVTQALLAARGGETPAQTPAGENEPAFQAETARLMAAAEDEIRRTMPKKLPPQGDIFPPEKVLG